MHLYSAQEIFNCMYIILLVELCMGEIFDVKKLKLLQELTIGYYSGQTPHSTQ